MKQKKGHGSEMKTNFKKLISKIFVFAILFITLPLITTTVWADGGMIPYHEFTVYEPGQKAIIGWNGEEEVMILSVDVYSEDNTKALHMVPFPSLPEVQLGSVKSFNKIEELMNRYNWKYDSENGDRYGNETVAAGPPNVEIVFHEKIGPHDITTVQINSPVDFTEWVNDFLEGKGIVDKKLPDDLDRVVRHYTDNNIRYFAFDVIELESNKRSVEPIVYRFETDYLLFPLEISSIIEGSTEITLALVTPEDLPVNMGSISLLGFENEHDDYISTKEQIDVDETLADLFDSDCHLRIYKGYFSLKNLKDDVLIKRLSNVNWVLSERQYVNERQICDPDGDGCYDIVVETPTNYAIYNGNKGEIELQLEKITESDYKIKSCQFIDINDDGITDAVISTLDNEIIAINGKDETQLWSYELDISTGFYPYNDIRYLGKDTKSKVIIYTSSKVMALYGPTGVKLWEHELSDTNKNYIKEIIVAKFDNEASDLLILNSNDELTMLSGNDGKQKWSSNYNDNYEHYLIENLDEDSAQEFIYCTNDHVFVIDTQTGDTKWETNDLNKPWSRIYNIGTCDFDNDDFLEVYIYDGTLKNYMSNSNLYLLDGATGEVTTKMELNYDRLGIGTNYINKVEICNLDGDNNIEFLLKGQIKLFVVDNNRNNIIWNFSSGEYIRDFEVRNIDKDSDSEIIMTTSNDKLYMIEFVEHPHTKKNSNGWSANNELVLGSILLPIILFVILIIIMLRALKSEKVEKLK